MAWFDWFRNMGGGADDFLTSFSQGLSGDYWRLRAIREQEERHARQYAGILGRAPRDTGGPEGFVPGSGFLGAAGMNVGGVPTMGQTANFGAQIAGIGDDTYQQAGLGILSDVVRTNFAQNMQNQRAAATLAEQNRHNVATEAIAQKTQETAFNKAQTELERAQGKDIRDIQKHYRDAAMQVMGGDATLRQLDDVRQIGALIGEDSEYSMDDILNSSLLSFHLLRSAYRLSSPEALNMGDKQMEDSMRSKGGQFAEWLRRIENGTLSENDIHAIGAMALTTAKPLLERVQGTIQAAQQAAGQALPVLQSINTQMPRINVGPVQQPRPSLTNTGRGRNRRQADPARAAREQRRDEWESVLNPR